MTVINPLVDPVRFSTSWCMQANHLAWTRAVFCLYILITIIVVLVQGGREQAGQFWSYFTNITFCGLFFYFAVSALHSFTYWRSGIPALQRWGKVLQALHSLFYTTIVIFPFVVTVVYWGVIYSGFSTTFEVWGNVSRHALNSVFALFELVIARTNPLPWIHLLWLIIIMALYLGVAYITVASEHFYVYSFLDEHEKGGRGRVAAYVFGILAALIVAFVVVKYLILLRKWIVETKLKNPGMLEHCGPSGRYSAAIEELGEYQEKK